MVLTNVPGPRKRLSLAGTPLGGVLVWAPCSGSGSRLPSALSVFSYAGKVTVGFLHRRRPRPRSAGARGPVQAGSARPGAGDLTPSRTRPASRRAEQSVEHRSPPPADASSASISTVPLCRSTTRTGPIVSISSSISRFSASRRAVKWADALGSRPARRGGSSSSVPIAALLPVVDHRDGRLGRVRTVPLAADEAGHADALARRRIDRSERLVVVVVDVGEVGDDLVRELRHRREEALIARLRPEPLEAPRAAARDPRAALGRTTTEEPSRKATAVPVSSSVLTTRRAARCARRSARESRAA